MNSRIKTVVFDIGNVLMDFEWGDYVRRLIPEEETRNKVNEAIFGNHLWDEMDRGLMNDREILAKAIQVHPEVEAEIRNAFDHVGGCLFPMDYAVGWVQEVKSLGNQVLYLSNYSHYIMESGPEVLNFLPYMDGGVFSCDVHCIKPEPEIFRILTERYGLDPGECLFIDDNRKNIEAAGEYGLIAFLFEGYEKSYPEIMKLLR